MMRAMPRIAAADAGTARPFVKWAGGKTQLLEQYGPLLPTISDLATYHEPFVGSGAVFFHLRAIEAIPARAVLSDVNEHLITTWQVVRDQPEKLALMVLDLAAVHTSEAYYAARDRYNTAKLGPLERAALLVYLNKAGFNGLYRVNSSGAFNVPVGRSVSGNVHIPDVDALVACSRALRNVDILHAPFTTVLDRARPGDFAYFDPPYLPVSDTAFFTDYAREGFGKAEQELLRDVFVQLDKRGCKVMLSNSGNLEVLALYKGYDVTTVRARRSINSRTTARGPVTEVVVRNYGG